MTTPNTYLAFPFLRAENGVIRFWISQDETLDISIADLGLASVASIVMFEDNSEIEINPAAIDYELFTTATPDSADYLLYSDVSAGGVTKKATISDIIGSSGAPVDATYVVLSSNSTLTNESVLTAGSGISLASATVSVDFASVQAYDATLTSIALLGTGADKMIYTTGVDTWAESDITAAGRAILDDASASDQRTTLGLGTLATQSAASVNITGGTIAGITDLAVADGGTGASDAPTARTNLGLVIGTDVQAYDAELAALAGLTSAADKGIQFTGAGTAATYDLTAAGKALLDDVDAAAQRTTLGLGTLATQSGTFSGTSSGTNTGDQNLFSTIAVSGQDDVVADSTSDTLTLVAGSNVTITTNAGTDTITISASGGGGGGGLADGDYGDITVSSGGTVMTIDNDVVTYAKMQNVSATDKILGRSTAGAGDVEEITCTSAGRALLDDADAAAQRTTLGLVIGTDVQAYDAELAALAGLTSAADKGIQFTGAGTAATYDLTAAGKALLDDADAAAQRTTLGVGTGDSPEFTAVNIGHASDTTVSRASAGDISVEGNIVYRAGGTDVPVSDGGTGSSTAAGARVNLLPTLTGNTLKVLRVNAGETDVEWSTAGGGSGDVTGPGSATDNAIARFDGTGGKTLQNSAVVINDDGEIRSSINSGACTGVVQSVHWCMLTADYTLASSIVEQKLFDTTANGTLTLPTGVYHYEAFIYMTSMSGSTGNMAFDPVGAGTAVTDRWGHAFVGVDNSSPLNPLQLYGSAAVTQQSGDAIMNSGSGTGLRFSANGMFRISTGGTIIPSGTLKTAAAAVVKAGSWFKITRLGADSETYVGAWT